MANADPAVKIDFRCSENRWR